MNVNVEYGLNVNVGTGVECQCDMNVKSYDKLEEYKMILKSNLRLDDMRMWKTLEEGTTPIKELILNMIVRRYWVSRYT